MSESQAPADVAVAFIEAFGRQDIDTLARYLAEEVVFESPRVRLTGARAVAEAVGQFAQAVIGVKILASLGDGEQALITYNMETGPFGTIRAVDHLVVRDGKIVADTLVFDTGALGQGTD
ncbi:nuclear transport factor 2 family protein [Nonomuraea sp. CA-141351]|uniref:nuclear transport factor 2 family protein n=1 Tax=Nonomuraea sp. CA-141351 TaxID=3239996 RepID=UPI003D94BF02